MSPVLFFSFLLLQIEVPLFFGFFLRLAGLAAFILHFFPLFCECLLRLRSNAGILHLLLNIALPALWVARSLLYGSFNRRTEL